MRGVHLVSKWAVMLDSDLARRDMIDDSAIARDVRVNNFC